MKKLLLAHSRDTLEFKYYLANTAFPNYAPWTQVLASSKEAPQAAGAPNAARGKAQAAVRLATLKSNLFRAVCRRVSRSLLNRDRLLFALRLAQVCIHCS